MMKKLVFEGAGWPGAEHNGVGNCRIRTRLKNKDGRVIYLEISGHITNCKGYSYIDHCFDQKDERTNYTKDLSCWQGPRFTYNKKKILDFVNEILNCDFDSMEVRNEGLHVHSTEEPLCSCEVEDDK